MNMCMYLTQLIGIQIKSYSIFLGSHPPLLHHITQFIFPNRGHPLRFWWVGCTVCADLDNCRNGYFRCFTLYLGDYGLLEHGPVVNELMAWCLFVRNRVEGIASVGHVEQCCRPVTDVALKRRSGGQKYNRQLVPGDRKLQQGQSERNPKLPPTEVTQCRLHGIAA